MINSLKILLGKDGFIKNDLLSRLGLTGMINQKVQKTKKLSKGEEVVIKFPSDFIDKDFEIKKVNFRVGDIVDYGDILIIFQNKKSVFEFENFNLGELSFIIDSQVKLNSDIVIAKIKGI